MPEIAKAFTAAAEIKAFDKEHRKKMNFNAAQYEIALQHGLSQYANLELARQRAAFTKWKALENLDKHLVEFESNFAKRGGKVIWALNEADAVKEILEIIKRTGSKKVIKSKSMIAEEIGMNKALKNEGIESLETDLGEYIQQLSGENAYHMVTPAMHKSKEEVAELLNLDKDSSIEAITAFVRNKLREEFTTAQIGITGANFIIADTGSIAVTENEGNAMLSMAFPKVHIVLTGIERVLPSITDLDLFWPLLSSYGTGQYLTAYNTLISGPKQNDETDGPEEMYVILLDNNRTNVLDQEDQRQALACIRCGACSNVCPVFKTIGGHAYGTTYGGPIGSVITPHLKGMEEYKHLSEASPLSGKPTEVCPVKIPLHKLLLYNRRDAVEKYNLAGKQEKWMFYVWRKAMLKRSAMNKGGATAKNFLLESFFKKPWGKRREFPKVAPKSFNEIWRESHPDILGGK
jgi:L-lactate dehydrogenase complex protein LldF